MSLKNLFAIALTASLSTAIPFAASDVEVDKREARYEIKEFVTPDIAQRSFASVSKVSVGRTCKSEGGCVGPGIPSELAAPYSPQELADAHVRQVLEPPFEVVPLKRRWIEDIYGWVPTATSRSGDDTLKKWRSWANEGRTFDCVENPWDLEPGNPPENMARGETVGLRTVGFQASAPARPKFESCLIVTTTPPINDAINLALCHVLSVGGVSGAPAECRAIAVLSPTESWVFARVAALMHLSASLGRVDFTISIFHSSLRDLDEHSDKPPAIKVSSGSTDEAFVAAVVKALSSPRLSLSVATDDVFSDGTYIHTVVGTADYRTSPIIENWRERVTVRVDVKSHQESARAAILSVEVSTTLAFSKQNTSRTLDYTLPTPQQEAAYIDAIKTALRFNLNSACKQGQWVGENNLRCQ